MKKVEMANGVKYYFLAIAAFGLCNKSLGEADPIKLIEAIKFKDFKAVNETLKKGSNPNAVTIGRINHNNNYTTQEVESPLSAAFRKKDVAIIELLLKHDAKLIESSDIVGATVFNNILEGGPHFPLDEAGSYYYRLQKIYEAQRTAPVFRFPDLEAILNRGNIHSIDTLLSQIPLNFRERSLLAYDSQSLHPSSDNAPRVILFNTYADFILAFHPDSLNVEMIEFNYITKHFDFRTITVNPTASSRISPVNPNECMQCHRKVGPERSPHPNWSAYFV